MKLDENSMKELGFQSKEDFEKKVDLEVETIDERLTTVASHRTMTDLKIKKDKKKSIVDTMSAVLILQMYLDRSKNI